jgi:hypothetical protein
MSFVQALSSSRRNQVISAMKTTSSGAIEMTGDIQITGALEATSIGTSLLNTIFPIGSIYFTASAINPSTSIGGTWLRYAEGKCLFSVDDNDTDFSFETTGGVKEVVLTEAQMPVHTHGFFDNQRNFRTAWVGFVPQGGNQQEHYISQNPDTTNPAGGFNGTTQPFNNMPPYIAIYCWKRTS